MRKLLLAFTLFVPAPAQGDPACLAAPTQDCVFQMALDQALDRPKVGDIMQGLVETALWQEAAGRDDWATALELLPPILRATPDLDAFDVGTATMLIACRTMRERVPT